jgi:plastocyanin
MTRREETGVRRRLAATILAVVLLTAFAVQPANAAVVIKAVSTTTGFKWKPHKVSVAKGTKVVWKAVSGTHTVTAYAGNWSKNTTIAQGTKTSFVFKKAGVYKFRCTIHSTLVNGVCSGMCGKVVVG